MTVHDIVNAFIQELRDSIDALAERGSIDLWKECEDAEAPIADRYDEVTLSLWNHIQQITYYKTLDTFVDALEVTLLDFGENHKESEP